MRDRGRRAGFVRPGSTTRVATYNTATLAGTGEAEGLARDLQAAGVHLCGLQEVRYRGSGELQLGEEGAGWHFLWSGAPDDRRRGVGALLSPSASRALQASTPISDRLMRLDFAGTVGVTVLVAYAPIESTPPADKDAFWEQLSRALHAIPEHRMRMVLGDLNARVGTDTAAWRGYIGGHGLRRRRPPWAAAAQAAARYRRPQAEVPAGSGSGSEGSQQGRGQGSEGSEGTGAGSRGARRPDTAANNNGERCLGLCAQHGLFVANTFFCHKDTHTASWRPYGQHTWATLDLVLADKRFQSSVTDTRVLPTATSHRSDHRPVVCDMRLRLTADRGHGARGPPRLNVAALQSEAKQAAFQSSITAALAARRRQQPQQPADSEGELHAFTTAVREAALKHAGTAPRGARAPWLTASTLQLCEQKRVAFLRKEELLAAQTVLPEDPSALEWVQAQGQAAQLAAACDAYKALCKETRAAARRDQAVALEAKAQALESHMGAHRTREAYRLLRELSRAQEPPLRAILKPTGELATGQGVADTLAAHFSAVLNADTCVAPELLAAIPEQPTGEHHVGAVQAAATAADQGVAMGREREEHQGGGGRDGSGQRAGAATRGSMAAREAERMKAAAATEAAAAEAATRAAAATAAANGAPPTMSEVEAAIRLLRNTSPGLDGLSAQLLKLGGRPLAEWAHRVITRVWETGKVPLAWKRASLKALYKGKKDRRQADNYRGVTLLDVSGKVFVGVIHQRIRHHLCGQLLDAQQGFRPGRGTGGALFCMRRLAEMAREWGAPLHAAFVDFRKAFDSVPREALWRLLLARGVAPKLVELTRELYSGSQACVTADGGTSGWFDMRTGVRQGCPMSPTLFNVYIDFLARLLTQRCQELGVGGFRVAFRAGADLVPAPLDSDPVLSALLLLYADDMVLMADSQEALRATLRELDSIATGWGMQINYEKTKVVVFGEGEGGEGGMEAAWGGGEGAEGVGQVQRVSEFSYLGCLMHQSVQQETELGRRLAEAGRAFHRLKPNVFKAKGVSQTTRLRIYQACVLSILMYGAAETWALTHTQWRRVDAFHTDCLRYLTRTQHRGPNQELISNEQLYELAQMRPISEMVRQHALRWLGHLGRMAEGTMAQQLLFASAPAGQLKRVAGGSGLHLTWNRAMRKTLRELGIEQGWESGCLNRTAWKEKIG